MTNSPSHPQHEFPLAAPDEADASIVAAHRLFAQQRFGEAVMVFKRYPAHPIARYLIGEAYERAPEFKDHRYLAPLHYYGAVNDVPDMAAFRLGWCYSNGIGVATSKKIAAHWYITAGHAGVIGGYFNAAQMLWTGVGDLDQDRITAHAWILVAATLEDKDAADLGAYWYSVLERAEQGEAYQRALSLYAERELWGALFQSALTGLSHSHDNAAASKQMLKRVISRISSK